jgi:hypothetical protein
MYASDLALKRITEWSNKQNEEHECTIKPIEAFESIKQAVDTMKYWINTLGLTDWTIKVKLCEPHEFKLQDVDGECEYEPLIKSAVIRILKPEHYGDRIQKYCAEKILVHELLHCKMSLLDTEDAMVDRIQHQIMEDITRALLQAKYGVNREWFDNISY